MTSFMLSSSVTFGFQPSSFLALVMSNQILVTSPCHETPVVVTTGSVLKFKDCEHHVCKFKDGYGFAEA